MKTVFLAVSEPSVSSLLIRLALAKISLISVDADAFKDERIAPGKRLSFFPSLFVFIGWTSIIFLFLFFSFSPFLFFSPFSVFLCPSYYFETHGDIAKMPVLNLSELNIVLSVLGPYLGARPSLGSCR